LGKAFFHHGERRSWAGRGQGCTVEPAGGPGASKVVATEALARRPHSGQQCRLAAAAELLCKRLSAGENVVMEPSCC